MWFVEHLGFEYKVLPVKIVDERDFPEVAKTLPSLAGTVGLIPGQAAKMAHALQLKSQNRSNIVTNNKDFKTLKNHLKKNIVDENSQSGLQAYSIDLFVEFMDNKVIHHPDFLSA